MIKPTKFQDAHRFNLPYVPVSQQGEGYLQKRFEAIRARQKEEAVWRLKNAIEIKRRAK